MCHLRQGLEPETNRASSSQLSCCLNLRGELELSQVALGVAVTDVVR